MKGTEHFKRTIQMYLDCLLYTSLTTVSDNSDMYVYFSMTENQLLALTRQYGSKALPIPYPGIIPGEIANILASLKSAVRPYTCPITA